MLAPPELAKAHPSGKSPVIEDEGRTYAESGHILEYLVTKYGQESELIWRDADEENTIKYALYAAESNINIAGFMIGIHRKAVEKMPIIVSSLASRLLNKIDSFYATNELDNCMKNLDTQIHDNNGYYCNGRLTVADIMYETTVNQLLMFGAVTEFESRYPNVAKWRKTLSELPTRRIVAQKDKDLNSSP